MRPLVLASCLGLALLAPPLARDARALEPAVTKYVAVSSPRVVLEHVEVIDGTGAAPKPDRNVTIEDGKIAAIGPGADEPPRAGTTLLDLRGHAVMPGIVGLHEHLFFMACPSPAADGRCDGPALFHPMPYSAPRLLLANGVTTIRTTGSASPYADVKLARAIEAGRLPGPHVDVTGPYLGARNANLQMPELAGPEDARATVAFWADRGVTSFKAYANVTRAELKAAVDEAHKRGLKVTGHLCSVTYDEAIDAGIDDLEHGFMANTALSPDKKPDLCPDDGGDETLDRMAPDGPEAKRLFARLVEHHVAVTSTLALRASASNPPPRDEILRMMSPPARAAYLADRALPPRTPPEVRARRLRREMDLERAFVAAGGLLVAGSDAIGLGGLVPGFADQREIELLVEAGFSPLAAIRIATLNGAIYLGRQSRVGSIAVGKDADLVVVKGDPAARIGDVENVAIVFKDGVGYDRQKLLDAAAGHFGEY